jgi:hypothetical protein
MNQLDHASPTGSPCGEKPSAIGGLLKFASLIALVAIASGIGNGIVGNLRVPASPEIQSAIDATVVAILIVYIVLMALPFCPGIEIGLALIALMGRDIVPLVYLATIAALMLAFLAGRLVPARMLIEVLELLRLRRARDLLQRIAPLDTDGRLQFLSGRDRPRAVRFVLRHRYVALAIALNTPGNLVLGDGGGIALAAGVSRLFSVPGFALTVALAVAPIPALLLFAGPALAPL